MRKHAPRFPISQPNLVSGPLISSYSDVPTKRYTRSAVVAGPVIRAAMTSVKALADRPDPGTVATGEMAAGMACQILLPLWLVWLAPWIRP